jgi:hypothetical protein
MRNRFVWAFAALFAFCALLAALRPGWASGLAVAASFLLLAWAFTLSFIAGGLLEGARRTSRWVRSLVEEPPPVAPEAVLRDEELGPLWRRFESVGGRTAQGPAGERARRALAQVAGLADANSRLVALLESKLDPGELTFARYRDAGLHARASVIRELGEISSRLSALAPVAASAGERERFRGVDALLEGVERAIGGLRQTGIAVSEMRGKSSTAPAELEELVRELDELAARARKF